MQNYILDACAMLAHLNEEEGADVVADLIEKAKAEEISLCMNAANLIEVYYDRIREAGIDLADKIIKEIYASPISVIEELTPAIVREASYFKAAGKMSFADAILIGTAKCTGATVVTCDHVELGHIEKQENIPFLWIRPQ
jgi:predicted nucleic acid-binding protein